MITSKLFFAIKYLFNHGPIDFIKKVYSEIRKIYSLDNNKDINIALYNVNDYQLPLEFYQHVSPIVSIIIPVYNQWFVTLSCLISIYMNSGDLSYEIIIGDDNSTDETTRHSEYVCNIRLVRNTKEPGFISNCNSAAKHARGKYLVFLNNDTNVQKGWLESLVALMEKDEDCGLAGSKLIYPNGKLQEAGGIIWQNGR